MNAQINEYGKMRSIPEINLSDSLWHFPRNHESKKGFQKRLRTEVLNVVPVGIFGGMGHILEAPVNTWLAKGYPVNMAIETKPRIIGLGTAISVY